MFTKQKAATHLLPVASLSPPNFMKILYWKSLGANIER